MSKQTTRYVLGFMFSPDFDRVALIEKQKPVWQRGKLNGIGGKIEPWELSIEAMVREFREETGCNTTPEQWTRYGQMGGELFSVDLYAAVGDLATLKTTEGEKVVIDATCGIHPLRTDIIENLPWLIALAIDSLRDGRPCYANVFYPPAAPIA